MTAPDWQGTALAIHFDPLPGAAGGEGMRLVLVNAGTAPVDFRLPDGTWHGCLATDPAQDESVASQPLPESVRVAAASLWVARA